jgi:hypothetical protein
MDGFGERAALLAGLDTAMSQAQQHQRARLVGQTTLFDLMGAGDADDALSAPQFTLPNVPAADRRQRLSWEKEMTGLYISEHPLSSVARALTARVTHALSELTEEMSGQNVVVGGFISSLRLIPTKKGDLMAAVELEDLTTSAEVIVFPRTYQIQREALKEDNIVLIRGKVDTRDDRPKILAESVELLELSDDEVEEEPSTAPSRLSYVLDDAEAEAAVFGEGARVIAEARATVVRAEVALSRRPPDVAAPTGAPAGDLPLPEPAAVVESFESSVEIEPEFTMDEEVLASLERAADEFTTAAQKPSDEPSTPGLLLELTMERSALQDRDVNRLLRINQVLERFPGRDVVVLRLAGNSRDATVLQLGEGVRCCPTLLDEVMRELGESAVRVRHRATSVTTTMAPSVMGGPQPAWPGARSSGMGDGGAGGLRSLAS